MQHDVMLHIQDMAARPEYRNEKGSIFLTVDGASATIKTARGTYTLVKHPTQNYYAGMLGECKAHVIPGKSVAGHILSHRLIYWEKGKQAE